MERPIVYLALKDETRTHVDTACAAYHLNRAPRTLRAWASGESTGPLKPRKLNRMFLWSVEDIKSILSKEQE
jgi:hypothetical protein